MNSIKDIISDYRSGKLTMEAANAALGEAGAAFHLAAMTEAEREKKRRLEDAMSVNGSSAPLHIPKGVDASRRYELAGQPLNRRLIVQHTRAGDFLCEYDDQGYFVKSLRLPEGGENHA